MSERRHRRTEVRVDEEPGGPTREVRREVVVEDQPDGSRLVTRSATEQLRGVQGRPGIARQRTYRDRGVLRPERPTRIVRRERIEPTRWGPARVAALVGGIVFATLAILEAYRASVGGDLLWGATRIAVESPVMAGIHGIVAVLLFTAALANEGASRGMLRVYGVLFAGAALFGLLGRQYIGDQLALNGGLALPWAYVALYGVAALVCLAAGFAPRVRRTVVEEHEEPVAAATAPAVGSENAHPSARGPAKRSARPRTRVRKRI